jgi:uncharacterized protein
VDPEGGREDAALTVFSPRRALTLRAALEAAERMGRGGVIARGLLRLLALPLLALIFVYRKLVSPVLPPACRYYPSCSQYAEEAVRLHGPLLGPWLALRRLLRCHPWAIGGPDPVPHPSSASQQRT